MTWGAPHITEYLFKAIKKFVPEGSSILEFGSGWGSSQLGQVYHLTSVEDKEKWVGAYSQTTYIHAPRVSLWYDVEAIKSAGLPNYSGVLVDGHDDNYRLKGLIENSDLFNWNATWFFDDLNINEIHNDLDTLSKKIDRPYIKYQNEHKPFAIINGRSLNID